MNVSEDPVLSALNAVVRSDSAAATIETTLQRVRQQLAASANVMAWELIPHSAFCRWPSGEHPFLLDLRDSCWSRYRSRATSEQPPAIVLPDR